MAELKTKPTGQSVQTFLESIEDEKKRQDSFALLQLIQESTGCEPKMWGDSIVGYGDYHYKSPATGREGDWFLAGFSPRKQNLTLYLMGGFAQYESLMAKLGKYTTGKSCLYVKKLTDINMETLKELVKQSTEDLIKTSPQQQ
ncbi:MAG: DUF1801 domain-containing protein [Chloroflexi bacterium]|nr:DUF1801 domain-containing protein [Chloroflexota bacterium]